MRRRVALETNAIYRTNTFRIASYADSYAHFGGFLLATKRVSYLIDVISRYPRGNA